MRFPYNAYPIQGIGTAHVEMVYRPTVPIRFIGPTSDGLAYGLVDTGADEILLPDRFIGPLGVVIEPDDHATIVALGGGVVPVRYGTIDLELRKRSRLLLVRTGRFPFRARVILGHLGFLEHFTASFNGHRRYVSLTSNGTAPASIMSNP